MTFKTKITTAIGTGAILLQALSPAAFAATVDVSGNGAFSDSDVSISNESKTIVDQTNDATVTNNISSNASTGGNSSSFNTGGDSRIVTGDAINKVDVSTAVNVNKALIDQSGSNHDFNAKISGNGAFSDNTVDATNKNLVKLNQDNDADITNDIHANANTGKNDSSFNTGGDSIILTGDAKTIVSVNNQANENIAKINNGGGSSGASVNISGNGAFSDNQAKLRQDSAVIVDQYNNADISNYIHAKANTGYNDSKFNTGGTTAILTGNAGTKVGVDNLANFNAANISGDYLLDGLKVKISGNGAESNNYVTAKNRDKVHSSQDNYADLYNDVYSNAKTGHNDVSFSTADVYDDPIISTGDSWSSTHVSNESNVNKFRLGLDFNLHDVLSYFHLG